MTVGEPDDLSKSPAALVAELCALVGAAEVQRWCMDVLSGRAAHDDPDRPSITWLGGGPAANALQQGNLVARGQDYWPRVWAARGLLYAWDQDVAAAPDVVEALGDESWRVREMAAKVVARHKMDEAAERLRDLVGDPVPRVRAAAIRALGAAETSAHVTAVRSALHDESANVRQAAARVLDKERGGSGRGRAVTGGSRGADPARSHRHQRRRRPQRRSPRMNSQLRSGRELFRR